MEEIKISTRNTYTAEGIRSIEPVDVTMVVNSPNGESPKKLTKEDVWGKFDVREGKRIDRGMVVARHGETCPIFKDEIPYKSVTVVGPKNRYEEIVYWLEYVHGGDCVVMTKELDDLRVAIRSDYQCW